MEIYKPLAEAILGGLAQWFMFGPKKFNNVLAWGILVAVGVGLWVWLTPDAGAQWAANWRMAIGGCIGFLAASKGFGSFGKAIGLAPATNSK